MKRSLDEIASMLVALGRSDRPLAPTQYLGVFDSMVALEKTMIDARNEIGSDAESLRDTARHVAFACLATLSAAMAHDELRRSPGGGGDLGTLDEQAAELARRASSDEAAGAQATAAAPSRPGVPDTPYDEAALQGLALALRKVDHALSALGR